MRKVALFGLLAAIALTFGVSAGAEQGPMGVGYQAFGPDGLLQIVNGEGQHFLVTDAYHAPILDGVAGGPHFVVPCPNAGPDMDGTLLRVFLDSGVEFVIDDPDDWGWE